MCASVKKVKINFNKLGWMNKRKENLENKMYKEKEKSI